MLVELRSEIGLHSNRTLMHTAAAFLLLRCAHRRPLSSPLGRGAAAAAYPPMHPASARTTRRRQSHASAAAAAKEDADGPEQTPARVPLVVPITDADHGSRELLRQVPGRVAAALRLGPHEVPVVKAPGREGLRVDGRDHFAGDAITTARWLLGAKLVRVLEDGRRLSGRVVEVEAYLGVGDAAAHSFRAKRTSKNDAMYKAGGTTYIYQCHRYFCMNVICGGVDEPTGKARSLLGLAVDFLDATARLIETRAQQTNRRADPRAGATGRGRADAGAPRPAERRPRPRPHGAVSPCVYVYGCTRHKPIRRPPILR